MIISNELSFSLDIIAFEIAVIHKVDLLYSFLDSARVALEDSQFKMYSEVKGHQRDSFSVAPQFIL